MTLDQIQTIKMEMAKIIGPIGKFIVEKQVKVMGYTENDLPANKIPELIDKVIDILCFLK